MKTRGDPAPLSVFRSLHQEEISLELGSVCVKLPLMIFEEEMAKQSVAKNLREANVLTFIMESTDFRHYRPGTGMFIHTIVQAGSAHDHAQG